ncbi:MAG: hypothetical protein QXS54_12190 [Candidatus Methanomethylicaceae archaeon]
MKFAFTLYNGWENVVMLVPCEYLFKVMERMRKLAREIAKLQEDEIVIDEFSHRFRAEFVSHEKFPIENDIDVVEDIEGGQEIAYLCACDPQGEEFYIYVPAGAETAMFTLDELRGILEDKRAENDTQE